MKKKTRAYIKIWWVIVELFDLSPAETLLMFLIYNLSRSKGYCYASKSKLAEIINVTPPTIFSNINKLIGKGLIYRFDRPDKNGVSCLKPTEKFKEVYERIDWKDPCLTFEILEDIAEDYSNLD